MPNWTCRTAGISCAAILMAAIMGVGCGARKPEPTAGVTMTPERLQDQIDQIRADPSLNSGQKTLKIQMLRSHVTVTADAGGASRH